MDFSSDYQTSDHLVAIPLHKTGARVTGRWQGHETGLLHTLVSRILVEFTHSLFQGNIWCVPCKHVPQHKYSTEKKADIVVSYSFISVGLKDINYDFQIPLRSPAEEWKQRRWDEGYSRLHPQQYVCIRPQMLHSARPYMVAGGDTGSNR